MRLDSVLDEYSTPFLASSDEMLKRWVKSTMEEDFEESLRVLADKLKTKIEDALTTHISNKLALEFYLMEVERTLTTFNPDSPSYRGTLYGSVFKEAERESIIKTNKRKRLNKLKKREKKEAAKRRKFEKEGNNHTDTTPCRIDGV